MKILGEYPSIHEYVRVPEVNWFEYDAGPASKIPMIFNRENLERRTDVVSIDISQEDLAELKAWMQAHDAAVQDPRVMDAWRAYRTLLEMVTPRS